MPPKRINVVWFKCTDLRTHDHAALKAAHAEGLPVLHLYVFDPFWHAGRTRVCGFPKTGALRTRFQLEALADLSERLEAVGHRLCTRLHTSTKACFEELCRDYTVNAVFAFREICSEELRIEGQVRKVLQRSGQGQLRLFWGFELYHRDDLTFDPTRTRGAFNSYTAFRKRVEENSQIRSSKQEEPRFLRGDDSSVAWARADERPPTVQEAMGQTYDARDDPGEEKDPRAELKWRGGETAGLARLKEFLWDEDNLGIDYVGATMTTDPSKSCMRDKAMSKFSPWLAHGCISPRLIYEEVKRYERERRKTKSTYWLVHEMVWRDFSRFGSLFAGTSIFKIGGPQNVRPSWPWNTDQQILTAWKDGKTGFPFVDCFMRELKVTGYCNHMGRECSGWFFIGDLGMDWRMGGEWFESVLLDYEPCANWFNWTYRCLPAAGRGTGATGLLVETPGHTLAGLEILKWGTQHDPDATYIKRWIPELQSLPATTAREPWRLMLLEGNGAGGGSGGSGELRPLPRGKFDVSRGPLEAVVAMGFNHKDAAVALYRTWEDPDAAVALLLSEGGVTGDAGGDEDADMAEAIKQSLQGSNNKAAGEAGDPIAVESDDEEAELAKALAMSMEGGGMQEGAGSGESRKPPESAKKNFEYGVDYPRPIIRPVSLRSTEEQEEQARQAQAQRDRQIEATRRSLRSSSGGRGGGPYSTFNKAKWEEQKRHRPAETPTSANVGDGGGGRRNWRSRDNDTEDGPYHGSQGGGYSSQKGSGGAGKGRSGDDASWRQGKGGSGNSGDQAPRRRWAAKDGSGRYSPEDRLRGS
eukprot:TRINITY_DN32629_c0_g1_i1.p1 TRINITY_DN32629_c0_g1~~TRINITY_DN32629_c0_g1_i1.p1  ORF type:complete len:810 (-),score=190.59 TRINITY_DN32629_c0_g1_i1:359-2788(-)